jgi:hypothetical protein
MILVNGKLCVYGVLASQPFGAVPLHYNTQFVSSSASPLQLLQYLIDKCDEKAIQGGILSEPTGYTPTYVTLEQLSNYTLQPVISASPTPYRVWYADPITPANSRIQTNPSVETINIYSDRSGLVDNLLHTLSYETRLGTILEGPLYNWSNDIWWYRVNWDDDIDTGWTDAANLQNIV